MPEWSDTGIILSARAYGENKGVINLLTSERGRHAGLVHGFDSRTKKGIYEPEIPLPQSGGQGLANN